MISRNYLIVSVISLLSSYLPTTAGATLQCFKCTTIPPSIYANETIRLCSTFDYSDKYIVDCPYSTFCMKKDFTVNLTTAINGTSRDCAPQRYDYQDFKNGKWQMEVSIEEPYHEGCTTADDKGQKISRTRYCYCKGDLCNSSTRLPHATNTIVLAVLYITVKLIVNIR